MKKLFVTLMASSVLSTAFAAEQPKRETYEQRYGAISDHNIFSKERPIHRQPATHPTNTPQREPEESLVLRGVTLDNDGNIRAYVEDMETSKILKLGVGDSVGRGKISGIDIDAVEYERNGTPIWIEAGADFTGKQVIAVTSESSGSSAPTTGPTEVINPNDPNLTMEQKLKLRRMQERGK